MLTERYSFALQDAMTVPKVIAPNVTTDMPSTLTLTPASSAE